MALAITAIMRRHQILPGVGAPFCYGLHVVKRHVENTDMLPANPAALVSFGEEGGAGRLQRAKALLEHTHQALALGAGTLLRARAKVGLRPGFSPARVR